MEVENDLAKALETISDENIEKLDAVYASLRSVQNRHLPDVVHPVRRYCHSKVFCPVC